MFSVFACVPHCCRTRALAHIRKEGRVVWVLACVTHSRRTKTLAQATKRVTFAGPKP